MTIYKRYSLADKQRMVAALDQELMDRATASLTFGIAYKSVCRIYRKACENDGTVVVSRRGGAHHKKMTDEMKDLCRNWLFEDCSLPDRRLASLLLQATGVHVSAETIRKAVKAEFHFSVKKITYIPEVAETEERWQQRAAWAHWFIDQAAHLERMIFVDETGFKVTMRRTRGRAPVGVRAVLRVPRLRSKNVTVMAALTKSTVQHYEVLDGNGNTERFTNFIDHLLGTLPNAGYTIVLDNASFHRGAAVAQLVAERGHFLKFLVPYSPFMNPIEYFFHEWKHWVREFAPENEADLRNAIDEVQTRVDPVHCENYVTHVLENCAQILEGNRNVN